MSPALRPGPAGTGPQGLATRPGAPATGRGTVARRLVRVRGVVQGVGFRPFVYSLATELGLTGWVRNDSEGVLAEVQGAPADLDAFTRRLRTDAPPLAVVETVEQAETEPAAQQGFRIDSSAPGGGRTLVSPDVATCDDCLAELADPADRRHRHPFITCTNCGPRYTIVTGLPYDRPNTTMVDFPLCEACRAEYEDPADRRFHAQPIACHECGPVLRFASAAAGSLEDPEAAGETALARARALLAAGQVVAVKGVGGYHLACDATRPEAVNRLRRTKKRGDKPFAVLVADLATAEQIAEVDAAEAALLVSSRRPIVLLRLRAGQTLVDPAVAPRLAEVGLMLPPSALHVLLLGLPGDRPGPRALVLTSGNPAGESIVTDDEQARVELDGLAEGFLFHDRRIHTPCDDSVLAVVAGQELPVRRSRGYAPLPVALPAPVAPTLAVGGDLKNAVALGQGRWAWLSAHIGDLAALGPQQTQGAVSRELAALVGVRPERVVADAHPRYHSRRLARERADELGVDVLTVQHHHAHVAAVTAEHGVTSAVLGFAFDGTGYGPDGAVWGGELLLADHAGFRRLAHLAYVPLPGGDVTVRHPYRMALAHLHAAGVPWTGDLPPVAHTAATEQGLLLHQCETGFNSAPTSSVGRLFDAVAALAGVRLETTYEAQAAMELQAAADRALAAGQVSTAEAGYPLPLTGEVGEPATWDVGELVRAVVTDVRGGVHPGVIGARLHLGLAAAVVAAARAARERTGIEVVALGGGVFANRLLLELALRGLGENEFTVLRHRKVPPNDGGLALGQLVVGGRVDSDREE